MVAVLACAMLAQSLPASPWVGYSGMPRLSVEPAQATMLSHSATIEIDGGYAHVTTVSLFRNGSNQPLSTTLTVPKGTIAHADGDGEAKFDVAVQWDNKPVVMRWGIVGTRAEGALGFGYRRDGSASVTLKPSATHSVRTSCRVPIGMAGVDRKMKMAAYLLESEHPVGSLKVAFRYGGKTVFNLPQVQPSAWPWQTGDRGAFAQHKDFTPGRTLAYVTYYPGGFERIGG